MSTLFEVETRRSEYNPSTQNLSPAFPPERQGLFTGVFLDFEEKVHDKFIKGTNIDNKYLKAVNLQSCLYKRGENNTGHCWGFQSHQWEGYSCVGLQRVIGKIDGSCLITTAYVLTAYIEPYYYNEEGCRCF